MALNSRYTIARGQREFPAMVKRAEKGELAVVTRHEKPIAYVISAERMEAMLETMELLANPEFMRALEIFPAPPRSSGLPPVRGLLVVALHLRKARRK